MSSELIRNNGRIPARRDREAAARAKVVYDDVRTAGLKVEGAVALGGHIMREIVQLDDTRRDLQGSDPVLNAILADIEMSTVRQVKKVQAELYDTEWGM